MVVAAWYGRMSSFKRRSWCGARPAPYFTVGEEEEQGEAEDQLTFAVIRQQNRSWW